MPGSERSEARLRLQIPRTGKVQNIEKHVLLPTRVTAGGEGEATFTVRCQEGFSEPPTLAFQRDGQPRSLPLPAVTPDSGITYQATLRGLPPHLEGIVTAVGRTSSGLAASAVEPFVLARATGNGALDVVGPGGHFVILLPVRRLVPRGLAREARRDVCIGPPGWGGAPPPEMVPVVLPRFISGAGGMSYLEDLPMEVRLPRGVQDRVVLDSVRLYLWKDSTPEWQQVPSTFHQNGACGGPMLLAHIRGAGIYAAFGHPAD